MKTINTNYPICGLILFMEITSFVLFLILCHQGCEDYRYNHLVYITLLRPWWATRDYCQKRVLIYTRNIEHQGSRLSPSCVCSKICFVRSGHGWWIDLPVAIICPLGWSLVWKAAFVNMKGNFLQRRCQAASDIKYIHIPSEGEAGPCNRYLISNWTPRVYAIRISKEVIKNKCFYKARQTEGKLD